MVEKIDVRQHARDALRAAVTGVALTLFAERSFAAVTVDQIAEAAGISRRTFFRYFPSKEDVVFADIVENGVVLRDDLAHVPDAVKPWAALRTAFLRSAGAIDADRVRWLVMLRVIEANPALRARNIEKHVVWTSLLIPALESRLGSGGSAGRLKAAALGSAALACLDVALHEWTSLDGEEPFPHVLADAFDALSDPVEFN